jgi:hypothetical protein
MQFRIFPFPADRKEMLTFVTPYFILFQFYSISKTKTHYLSYFSGPVSNSREAYEVPNSSIILDCKGFRKKLSLPDWVTMQAFAEMD